MPIYMRHPKKRGNTSKDAMPVGPHRTSTVGVNIRDLDRVFDTGAEVTLEALIEKGLIKNTKIDVKLLGQGDLSKKLSVTVHAASASAREKVEAAGGSLTLLREPKERLPKRKPQSARPAPADDEPEQEETEPQAEAEPDLEPEGEPDPEPEPEGEEG
jgi:large subunit ribosomal protein L15